MSNSRQSSREFEFSPMGLRALLDAVCCEGYQAKTFRELTPGAPVCKKTVLWRHDVDVSMDYAVDMARTEHDFHVRATYFVMLRSPFYNLFSRHSTSALKKILDLGHDLALHFDATFAERLGGSMGDHLEFEVATLSKLVGADIKAFSLHQPTANVLSRPITVAGLINTYNPEQMRGFEYLSDSNMSWRQDPMHVIAGGSMGLQILLHPIWWMASGTTTQACWDEAIVKNFASEQNQALETERAYGAERQLIVNQTGGVKRTT